MYGKNSNTDTTITFTRKTLRSSTYLYLPNECWEHVFKFLKDDCDDNNRHYLETLSVVSKQFLSITNRFKFSLTINGNPTRPLLRRLFKRFTNLTSLDLTRFHGNLDSLLCTISSFSTDISNLKSLKLTHQSNFPAIGLRDISKKITTLTSLTCSKIKSLSNDDLVLISDCFPFLEELDLSSSYHAPSLFDITGVGLNYMSMALHKLRKVNLSTFYNINDSLLLNLCKNCQFLEELIMFNCPFLTLDGIAFAARERPDLRSLSFRWSFNDNISSRFIDTLVSLKGLTCLEILSSDILNELLSSIAMISLPLRRLVFKNCRGYSFDGILSLLFKCQHIQHLDLQYNPYLSDQYVVRLSSFLGELVFINLSNCSMLTDLALFALVRNCPLLSEIKMEHTSIGKTSVEDSNSMMNLVVRPQLKSLCLAHNTYLRDENIIMFASIFPNLQFLDLSYNFRDISEGICEVLRCCKIRYLNLEYCLGLKLHRMNFIVPTLEVLILSNSKIDDRSLYMISKCFVGLRQLDLGCCYHVTKKGVRKVVEKCMKLREINLERCQKMNANIVDSKVIIRPSLRKITAPPSFSL